MVTLSLLPCRFSDACRTDQDGINGNIDADPLFVSFTDDGDPTNDNLHLSPISPAIDAGLPMPGSRDLDGSRNDIGAFGGPGGNWVPLGL